MGKPVFANGREVAHKNNGGISVAQGNVCKTPGPMNTQIPIPYPSIAESKNITKGPKTVRVQGAMPMVKGGQIGQTEGDKPGTGKGLMSGSQGGPAELMTFSFDVRIEGNGVGRLGDSLFHNKKNVPG